MCLNLSYANLEAAEKQIINNEIPEVTGNSLAKLY